MSWSWRRRGKWLEFRHVPDVASVPGDMIHLGDSVVGVLGADAARLDAMHRLTTHVTPRNTHSPEQETTTMNDTPDLPADASYMDLQDMLHQRNAEVAALQETADSLATQLTEARQEAVVKGLEATNWECLALEKDATLLARETHLTDVRRWARSLEDWAKPATLVTGTLDETTEAWHPGFNTLHTVPDWEARAHRAEGALEEARAALAAFLESSRELASHLQVVASSTTVENPVDNESGEQGGLGDRETWTTTDGDTWTHFRQSHHWKLTKCDHGSVGTQQSIHLGAVLNYSPDQPVSVTADDLAATASAFAEGMGYTK